MKYVQLPILWKDGELAMLEDLGIETTYEQANIKNLFIRIEALHYFYADKDPRYTCIKVGNDEMVVDLQLSLFIAKIDKWQENY